LYYRLNVFPIMLPPLRERREDIPLLVSHFAKKSSQQMGRPSPKITRAAMAELAAHDWPGNIRELQNAVERAVIITQEGPLQFDLPKPMRAEEPNLPAQVALSPSLLTRNELKRQERENIVLALKQVDGKVFGPGGAAEVLGMKPTTLASRIKALGIVGVTAGRSEEQDPEGQGGS